MLDYGISIRTPYRPERMNDLADAWIAGNHDVVLEAVRLHEEEVRGRIPRCVITKRVRKNRWSPAPVATILTMRNGGYSLQEIAEHTNLTKRTICRILKKQSTIQSTTIPIRQALSVSKLPSTETSASVTQSNIFGVPV